MARLADDAAVEARQAIAAVYKRFAEHEARGRSPLYEQVAASIAEEEPVLGFLAGMAPAKRQSNPARRCALPLRDARQRR
jgi:hypothetical protein